MLAAVDDNNYGQYDSLITTLAPALGPAGLDHLKSRLVALQDAPVEAPPENQRQIVGLGPSGPIYKGEGESRWRAITIRIALQEVASARGDVDGYIAQYDEDVKRRPKIAADIARRLLAAGRAGDALAILDASDPARTDWPVFELEDARIDVLEALGRAEEAQAARWAVFERALSAAHLRAYLKRLADFDDVEAEERALEHAQRYPGTIDALSFLVSWPALGRAAQLVVERAPAIDGDHYKHLSPAADALAAKHPLAATLVFRSMIDFALIRARSARYRHAARHLAECSSLAHAVADWGAFETHDAYVARLKAQHGRKSGFWGLVT